MQEERLSIEELADAAGLTRRAVRFYVQQRLLPTPLGVGRGKHYDAAHLARLQQIRDLQSAGHSLEEIRHLLNGGGTTIAPTLAPASTSPTIAIAAPRTPKSTPAPLRAELWRRIRIADGLELSFDAAKHNPTVEDLMKLRDVIAQTLNPPAQGPPDP